MTGGITIKGMTLAFILALLFFVPAGFWLLGVPVPGAGDGPPVPSLATIQTMRELAAIRVHLQTTLEGHNAHFKGRWDVHGEAIIGINLSKIAFVATDPEKRTVTLRLPPPHLIDAHVDHERSSESWVKRTAWLPLTDSQSLRDEAWKMADRKLHQLGQEPEPMQRAKVESERILSDFLAGMGWKATFAWQDETALAAR